MITPRGTFCNSSSSSVMSGVTSTLCDSDDWEMCDLVIAPDGNLFAANRKGHSILKISEGVLPGRPMTLND